MRHARRLVFLLPAAAALVAGVWGGLVRMQVLSALPDSGAGWLTYHGPLMVSGFLGTLIALERAVALGLRWPYAVPAVCGAGGAVLIAVPTGGIGAELLTAGAAGYVATSLAIVHRSPAVFTVLPAFGAGAWLTGNALWLGGAQIPTVTPWWAGFVILTIVGERIELARLRRPVRGARALVLAGSLLYIAGLLATIAGGAVGTLGARLVGCAMAALAVWLLTFDVARHTVRQRGLPRFTAVSLLAGYAWLVVGGVLLAAGTPLASGLGYDALIHAVFLGFAMSMIFGHAPLVIAAVLGAHLPYRGLFYVHMALLHAGVALRVGADLAAWPQGRGYGGIVAATALAVFVLVTAGTAFHARGTTAAHGPGA